MNKKLFNIKNIITGAMILSAGAVNAQQWDIIGNLGTNSSNYVGTIDDATLFLRTNGQKDDGGQAYLNAAGSFVVESTNNTNDIKGKGNIVAGTKHVLGSNTNSSIVGGWGHQLTESGGANFVTGQSNIILNGAGKSVAMGWKNTIRATNQFAIGVGIDLTTEYSGGFGIDLAATGNRSFVFGANVKNDIPYSVMFGLSKIPTMLIKDQMVGVRTTVPTANFHTVGTVRLESLPSGSGKALVVDANGNVMVATTTVAKQANDETVTELQSQIDDLKQELIDLKNLLKQTSVKDISSNNNAILYQNAPNPGKGETNIKYYLPADSKDSSIEIYSVSGQLVKSLPIRMTGEGNIALNNMKSGMYLYKLSVNGKTIDTKKMLIND